jgi:predicted nucleotidyltransferase
MNDQLINIRKILEGLKPELSQKYAVDTLGLFGSVVRDDFTKESDIDIIVTFNRPVGIEFIDLANELETKLNRKIDLVSKNGVKEKYFRIIEPQIIYV